MHYQAPARCFSVVLGLALGLLHAPGGAAARVSQTSSTPAPDSTQPARRALTLEDYYKIERLESPAISPDGRRVAFVRTVIIESENRRHNEIWVAPSDASEPPRRLTTPAFSASSPRWSPDGKLLAFSSKRPAPGAPAVEASAWFLRMDVAGEAFQIPGVEGTPTFSPDNRWIAFTRADKPKAAPPPATEFERHIEERFKGRVFDWMNYRFDQRGYLPDPRDGAASPPRELYLVAREGGTPRRITTLGVDVQAAVWRPDSGALALVANAHQRDEYLYERADLWAVSTTGEIRRLTDDGYDHDAPAWSPDGRALVALRSQGLTTVIQSHQRHGAAVDIVRLAADGGGMENLTETWDLIPEAPGWSADGRMIYFSGGIGGNAHLFDVDASGSGTVRQVTTGDRQLSNFSRAAGQIAYVSTDPTHPTEVFAAKLDGSSERRLTSFNDDILHDVQFSAATRMQYASKDATPVEGWIMLPRGYDSSGGRRYPLILNIHGGPHGAYGNEFSFAFQLLAAHGYAVLYTNPRGSTNYGEQFLWATWGGWGVLDYDDVMSGVDAVVKQYAIDEKKIGVAGYSYGGFLTNWIIGHTSRFAAAIVGAGISNWISDYGTADIPRTKESEFSGAPWDGEAGALLQKLSPITYAGSVSTPTLFIHGEADLRVPIEQGEQMYTALKKRRVPARFVRYPESYHGGWTPWNSVHRYYQELKWWDEYLSAGRPSTTSGAQK